MVPLPSDQEIASCVESLLRQQSSDPANAGAAISLGAVVHHVQAKLGGVDLSHKASFIRDQIDLLLGPPRAPAPAPGPFHPPFIPHQFLFHHPFPPHHPTAPPPLPAHLLHHHHHQMPMSTAVASAGVGNVPVSVSPEASSSSSSPFAQFGTHHELAFRYPVPSPPPPIQPQQPGLPIGSALAPKENAPVAAKRRGGPGGLSKICGVSPELQVIVGEPAMPRTQIVKQLWAYIRKNNLQDPNNKRKIICNDELRVVFETDCTDMFKMNKLLAKHIIPLEPTKDEGPVAKKSKTEELDAASESEVDQTPFGVSDALASFLGTGEKELLQSEALKRILDYIKYNQLEDQTDTTMIHCDSKLQQLFGCENLSTLSVPEMLACHLTKKS